jgi:hypothetical protein
MVKVKSHTRKGKTVKSYDRKNNLLTKLVIGGTLGGLGLLALRKGKVPPVVTEIPVRPTASIVPITDPTRLLSPAKPTKLTPFYIYHLDRNKKQIIKQNGLNNIVDNKIDFVKDKKRMEQELKGIEAWDNYRLANELEYNRQWLQHLKRNLRKRKIKKGVRKKELNKLFNLSDEINNYNNQIKNKGKLTKRLSNLGIIERGKFDSVFPQEKLYRNKELSNNPVKILSRNLQDIKSGNLSKEERKERVKQIKKGLDVLKKYGQYNNYNNTNMFILSDVGQSNYARRYGSKNKKKKLVNKPISSNTNLMLGTLTGANLGILVDGAKNNRTYSQSLLRGKPGLIGGLIGLGSAYGINRLTNKNNG